LNTSRPTSGPLWSPTIWCCSPASNWLSRPALPPSRRTNHIRPTATARNTILWRIAATNTRTRARLSQQPSPSVASCAIEKAPLWTRTS
jgi:hypothetical protein